MFNPFAVLLFFDKKKFLPYWHETGAPKFLFEYLKSRKVGLREILEERTMSRAELLSQEIEEAKAKSFLVQAGYLTFKRELSSGTEYEIGFPNLDAGQTVAQMILEIEYGLKEDEPRKKGNILREAVMNGRVELTMKTIEELFASVSYATY